MQVTASNLPSRLSHHVQQNQNPSACRGDGRVPHLQDSGGTTHHQDDERLATSTPVRGAVLHSKKISKLKAIDERRSSFASPCTRHLRVAMRAFTGYCHSLRASIAQGGVEVKTVGVRTRRSAPSERGAQVSKKRQSCTVCKR